MRRYCIWNVRLNIHKDALKRKFAWNKINDHFVETLEVRLFFANIHRIIQKLINLFTENSINRSKEIEVKGSDIIW